jgi:DNA-binding Xre family transcriptional regulator
MNLQEKLNRLLSNRPSEWKEEALGRIATRGWKRNSHAVALSVLRILQERKMNQTALANLMGVSQQQVSKIISGEENLTLETIDKLERALDVELIKVNTVSAGSPEEKTPEKNKVTPH